MQDAASTTTKQHKQYQCRHIFTDGHRCASPCLRQEEFCYYHHTSRRPVADPRQRRGRRSTFHLALPEDRSAIQASIGEVLQRIAANDIDPRRAGLLLYGLQIASLNLPKTQPLAKPATELQTVEEITIDPALGVLAPRTEVSEITKRKSPVAQLIERMMQTEEKPAPTPEPITIPTLQATADNLDLICSSPRNPKRRHFDRRRRTCRCSGEIRFSTSAVHNRIPPLPLPVLRHSPTQCHFDRTLSEHSESKGQWRNPLLYFISLTTASALPHRAPDTHSWLLYPMPASTPRI